MSNNYRGILWMSFHSFIVSTLFIMGKFLQQSFPALQVVFIYCFVSTLFISLYVIFKGNISLVTRKIRWHFLRSFLNLSGYCCFFKSLEGVDFNIATTISFTTPILASILGVLIYKEKALIIRWGALVLGFMGVLIILKPDVNGFSVDAIYILCSAILWASSDMVTRKIGQNEKLINQMFYMCVFSTLFTMPFSMQVPYDLNLQLITVIIATAICYMLHIIAISSAIQLTNFSIIMPFDYLRMPISIMAGVYLFSENIDLKMVLGSLLVILGGCLIIIEQYRLKKI